jgi:tetratricopeptide (TPR) repeat protein
MDGPLMRKINGKLFLALLVAGVVLAGGVVVVHHFQYQRIAQALKWQAQHAEEQGRHRDNASYLQRYLEFNPHDNAERARLARLWASDAFPAGSKARWNAVTQMDQVLRDDDDPNLRRLLVKVALEIGDRRHAKEHIEHLLSRRDLDARLAADRDLRDREKPLPPALARPDEATGELEGFWGQLLDDINEQPVEAIHCYRLAVRHAPAQQSNYVHLANLLRRYNERDPSKRQKNVAEADQVIDDLVKRNGDAFDSYLARWRYRREFDLLAVRETAGSPRSQNDVKVPLDTAAEDVRAALKRKPESIEVLLAAADMERLYGRAAAEDRARSEAQRRASLKEHRNRALGYLKRGLDLAGHNEALAGDNGKFLLLWHKGNLLLDDVDLMRAQAEEDGQPFVAPAGLRADISALIELVRRSQMPAAADYMSGRLLVHERQWAEAARMLERARALMSTQPDLALQADLYLGQCYEKLEEHAQMFKAFERVAQRDPTSVAAQLGMAAARWAQGQDSAARTHYDVLIRHDSVPARAWVDIARLEIQRQVKSDAPNWSEVDRMLDKAHKHFPHGNLEVTLLRAEVILRKGQPDRARRLLEAERDRHPKDAELWSALADLALRQKKPQRARSLLDDARKELGDGVGLRLAEARYLAAVEGKKAAAKIAELAGNRGRLKEDDQARLLSGLADVLVRQDDLVGARTLWRSLAALPGQRNNLRLRMLLFDQAMKEGDEEGMKQTLEAIRSVEQSAGTYHRYGQALLLIWKARRADGDDRRGLLAKARKELDRVLSQRPSWPPVFKARAEIAELSGTPDLAIKELQAAVTNGDNTLATIQRLAMLLADHKREDEARALAERVKGMLRTSSELGRLLVLIDLREGKIDQALEQMNQVVPQDSKDPKMLVWVAGVLAEAGRFTEAEKKLDAAIALGGEAAPWVAKVRLLVGRKRRDDALALIAQAKPKLARMKDGALGLARCYDAVNQPKQALRYYERALEASSDDPTTVRAIAEAHLSAGRASHAEPLLRRLADGRVNGSSAETQTWAQGALAMTLASGTDYQRFKEALGRVGLKLDEKGRLPEGAATREAATELQRARARVLASQSQRQYRKAAIDLFLALERRGALTADDQFVLAILLDQEGQAARSEQRLRDLVIQRQTQTPRYLSHYAMTLIARKRDLDSARKYIDMLKKLEHDREVGANGFGSVDLEARLLEAEGKGDKALALLRKHIGREGAAAEEVLLVLGSLSRQKRYQDAFALCEKTWEEGKCSPEAVGAVSVGLLGVMKPAATDAQVRALEKHLQAAVAKKPDSPVLLMHLATLYDKRGEYDQAAEMYQKVLRREKSNVVALNNLAWLLALRSGDAHKALDHINTAINGMGRRADLLDTRAMVHLSLKQPERALADLEEAVTEAPTPVRLYHLARVHHENKEPSRARETLRRAREKGLDVALLHPVEQQAARELLAEYGMR